MLSTYTSYSILAKDLLTSLNRVSQQTINAREAEYYKENIGKVGSVDEFLDDYRLYNYAMKAYGLEDMAYAKAFMRKVLESDLADPNSFVNLLTDTRYRTFANAFSFEASSPSAQTQAQLDEIIGLYSATAANAGSAINEETRYYNIVIDTVTSVDQLLNNDRLRNYMFTAFDIDPKTYSRETIRQLLMSDVDDPASYFNTEFASKIPIAEAARQAAADELAPLELRESHLRTIARLEADIPLLQEGITDLEAEIAALRENPDGLGEEELQAIIEEKEAQLAVLETTLVDYQEDLVTKQAEVADLDAVLIPRDEAPARIAALKTEIARQTAVITTVEKYRVLAAAYDFNTDGTATAGTVQDAGQKKSANELYTLSNPRVTSAAALLNKEYFESRIGSITTAAELVADPRLLKYVKAAFDLDRPAIVEATIRNVLTSDPDPNNPNSYINVFGGENKEKFFALRAAFNFQEDGTLAVGDTAQTSAQTAKTGEGYMIHYNDKDDEADELAINRFKGQIAAVKTVQDFVGEATIYNFALNAFGIDPTKVSALTIKNVLKSDLNDPRSYVYQLKDERFVELAKAFNFGPDGSITQPKLAQADSEVTIMSRAYVTEKSRFGTADHRKLAEEEAKYYSLQMQKIESVQEFMSDPRLVAFVLEANGIDVTSVDAEFMAKIFTSDLEDPDSFVNQQADRSYRKIVASFNFNADGVVVRPDDALIQSRRGVYETIDSYIRQMMEEEAGNDNAGVRLALYFERKAPSVSNAYDILADDALYEVFKTLYSLPGDIGGAGIDAQAELVKKYMNLEDLQDPEKVSKMVAKFAVLYDLENFSDTSGAVSILSGSGNISADTLLTMAQLRTGGM